MGSTQRRIVEAEQGDQKQCCGSRKTEAFCHTAKKITENKSRPPIYKIADMDYGDFATRVRNLWMAWLKKTDAENRVRDLLEILVTITFAGR